MSDSEDKETTTTSRAATERPHPNKGIARISNHPRK